MDDLDLLRQYTDQRSNQAFARLVGRHADLVYSAARRQLSDRHQAEDAVQAVFVLLSQKPHKVRGSLPGWLIQATHFICRNANKLAARRRFHERGSALMRPENQRQSQPTSDGPQWDQYSNVLDEAIAKLRPQDRDAVVLRYLRGLSLRDVGTALGVGEDAARKRVDRSIDRLRKAISAKAPVPAAAVMVMHLTTHGVQAAPPALVQSITGAAPHGSAAAILATHGARTILFAKIKIAAILLLGAGLAATGAVIAQQVVQTQPAPNPAPAIAAQTQPATQEINSDVEADVPGQVQLVRWDVLLNQAGLNALTKVAQRISSSSKTYQAYSANGYELRQCIADAIANNGVEDISHSMTFATESAANPGQLEFPPLDRFDYRDPSRPASVEMHGALQKASDEFQRQPDGIRISLSESDMYIMIGFGGVFSTLKGPASISYNGNLHTGNAIAFSAQITTRGNAEYDQLEVFEAFKAKTADMGFFQCQQNSGWWCQNGPAKIRQQIANANDWLSRAPAPPIPYADHPIKLGDGRILRIAGLSRPSVAPFCWWDVDGNPISTARDHLTMDGNPLKGLWAAVEIEGGSPESQFQTPSTQPIVTQTQPSSTGVLHTEFTLTQIPDETQLKVGVPTGPWTEIGRLDLTGQTTIDGITYTTSDPRKYGPDFFGVNFSRSDATDAFVLAAVDLDGKEATQSTLVESLVFDNAREGLGKGFIDRFNGINMDNLQYLRLYQRKRQWLTLTNFATQPTIPLPTN